MKPNRDLSDLASRQPLPEDDLFNAKPIPYADETKREAYERIKPSLPEIEGKILQVIGSGEKTDAELAEALGFGEAIHRVTKQRNALCKKHLLVMGSKKLNLKSGNRNQAWRAV